MQNPNSYEQLTITELLQGCDGRERWHTDFAFLQLLHWLGLLQEVLVQLSLQRCQPETQQELCSPSLQSNKSPALSTQCSFQLRSSSYSTDSLELPPRLLVEYCCLPELEEKLAETAQPRALLYMAAQSSPAGWQKHHMWVMASGGKSNILSMATTSFLEGSSHHKN